MRAKIISLILLWLLLPALALAAPAKPAPAAAPAAAPAVPDELAGDTADESAPAPGDTAPAAAPEEPAPVGPGSTIASEKFFALLLNRQQVAIEHYQAVNKALEDNAKDQAAALKAVSELDGARRKKMDELFEQHGVNEVDYIRSLMGTSAQSERSKYLSAHPETRDKISANSKQLRALEEQATNRIVAMTSRPQPPPRPPKKPK